MSIAPKDLFLREFVERTEPAPERMVRPEARHPGTITRRYNGVTMEIVPEVNSGGVYYARQPNEVYLLHIKADAARNGAGTAALQFLGSLADRHKVAIGLHAEPDRTDGLSKGKLIEIYQRAGFGKPRGDFKEMWREPQASPVF